ncbi:MAG: mannose-1-phosphate guanylyltransferase/mannose-6-phosphate isomerase [Desulfosudaceae bacterium]
MIIPVILAGGSGTRLWPMSRELFPKHLLRLTGSYTMFQQTLLRLEAVAAAAAPLVICNQQHYYPVARQMHELDLQPSAMILEPVGKNTAPAVAVAAIKALSVDPEARILVLPADHLIGDVSAFGRAVAAADTYAKQGYLITFGVIPDAPETGYGYIRKGRPLDESQTGRKSAAAYAIDQFAEKPDRPTAEKYLASGRYCWNSGMFLFRAADVYSALSRFAPEIVSACRSSWEQASFQEDAFLLDPAAFERCPADSIDYAVMEKTEKGGMIPFEAQWSDLGSWAAMWETGQKDADGNVISGQVMARDVKNSFLFSDSRLIAGLGLSDCVVVDTADALLVADRQHAQDVKAVASALKAENRGEAIFHATRFAKWGTCTEISRDARSGIRRICLDALTQLEFTSPWHGRLHWTVVSGRGRMENNGVSRLMETGQSVEIPPKSRVRVKSTEADPLVLIEVCVPGDLPEHLCPDPEK